MRCYPEHWGNGYATEAAAALRDWIFRETDWDHFIGFADVRNAALAQGAAADRR